MSYWLEASANKLRQTYIQGFLDISGGGIKLYNDISINFYDSGSNIPKFSIKSDSLRIPDSFGTYYDLSTSQLLYLNGLTQNLNTQLSDLVNRTKHITSGTADIDTMFKFDSNNNRVVTYSNIVPSTAYAYDLGSPTLPFGSLFVKQGTIHFVDQSTNTLAASISYNPSAGSLDISANGTVAPINNTKIVNGVYQTPLITYDGKVGIGVSSPSHSLDVSGTVNIIGNSFIRGNLNINRGDVVMDGNLVIGKTVYEGGVPISTKYLSAASPTIDGIATLSTAIINKNLNVVGDSSLNGRLFVGGDASLNANLVVLGNLITNTPSTSDNSTLVATTAFVKNQAYATISNATFSGTTTMVTGNVQQRFQVAGDVSLNSKLAVFSTATFSNRVYITNDAYMNSRLIVLGDSSMNGNVSINGTLIGVTPSTLDNSTKMATTAYVQNQGYAKLSGAYFTGDVSIYNRLIVSGDVSLNNRLFVNGDANLNGNVTTITQSISDSSTKLATTAFVKNQGYATLASPNFTGTANMETLNISKSLVVTADARYIGNLDVNGNLTAITQFNSDNSTKVATTQFVKNQGYATIASPTFTGVATIPTLNITKNILASGDISLNGNLFITNDLSVNGILKGTTPDTSDSSNKLATTAYVQNQGYAKLSGATFTGDISLNKRLFVGGDVSFNSNITVIGNTNLIGNAYSQTPATGDSSTLIATTAYVQNQGYSKLDSPDFTGIPTAPTAQYGTNSTQIATTEFVVTQLFSFINSNEQVYNSLQQLSSALSATDASFATTLAASLGMKADKESPVFTGTAVIPYLNILNGLLSYGDASFNGKLFVSGDTSMNGNVSVVTQSTNDNSSKVATTAYVQNQGYAKLSGATFTGGLNTTDDLSVGGNAILNNMVTIMKDLSLNGNLTVDGKTTFSDIITLLKSIIVNGDLSLNGNLSVNGNSSVVTQGTNDNSNKIATTAYVQNQGYAKLAGANFTGDVSLNTKLNVVGDVSLNKRLFIGSDLSVNAKLFVNGITTINDKIIIMGDASLNNNLLVQNQIYENGVSLINKYSTLESPTFTGVVGGITKSMVGLSNVDNTADIYKPISTATQLALNLKSNIASPNFTGIATIPILNVTDKLTVTNDVSLNGKMFVANDVSMNGNVSINGTLSVPTPATSDNSTKVATTEFVKSQNYVSSTGGNFSGAVTFNDSLTVLGDLSLNGRLFTNGDVSFNSNIFINGQTILNKDVSLNGNLSLTNNLSMNGNLYIKGDVSLNGIMRTPTPATSDFSTKVATTAFVKNQGYALLSSANFIGDVSMNSNLLVQKDTTLNQRLFLTGDASMNSNLLVGGSITTNANLLVTGKTILNNDVSLNSRLSIANDVSMNGKLFIGGDASLNGNLNVGGIFTTKTQDTTDSSTKVATTAFVKNQGYATLASPSFTGTATATTFIVTQNLISNSDAYMQSNLNVAVDTAIGGNLSVVGSITSTTPLTSDNSTLVATTAYVKSQPFAPLVSPTFTGKLTASAIDISNNLVVLGDLSLNGNMNLDGTISTKTPSTNDNSTKVATTAFVKSQPFAPLASPTFTGKLTAAAIDISNNLVVLGDASMNSNLYIGKSIYENGLPLANTYATLASPIFTGTVRGITKTMVDLSNVDNTSDINKPVSTAQQTALDLKANIASPSFTGLTKIVFADISNDLHIGGDVSMNGNLIVSKTVFENGLPLANTYATLASPTFTGIVSGITKSMVGLTNIDNTSDINKPVSTAQQTALNLKANISNPTFIGTLVSSTIELSNNLIIKGDASMNGNVNVDGAFTVKTPVTSDNSTRVATTAYVQNQGYAKLSGAYFTGDISANGNLTVLGNTVLSGIATAVTPIPSDNSTRVATTEFVQNIGFAKLNSPSFTGIPTAPTLDTTAPTTTQIATTKYVENKISDFFQTASASTLSAINQLSQALSNTDASFTTAIATQLQVKANIDSPTFSGVVTMPTTNITQNISVGGDLSMNGIISTGGLIYEKGKALVQTYATLDSPAFTGTVTGITKSMIGLSNVDNTADIYKPVSTAQQTALNLKANIASPNFTGLTKIAFADIAGDLRVVGDVSMNGNLIVSKTVYENGLPLANTYATLASPTFTGIVSGITKSMVDLSNVDNTSDINKPVSTAQQTALNLKANLASPSFTGLTKIAFADISGDLRVGGDVSMNGNLIVSKTVYENGLPLANTYATLVSPIFTGTVRGINKYMVDLSNVDNTSDINKPVSTAQQTALNLKANIASPSFTGTASISQNLIVSGDASINGIITTTTPASSDNSNKVATTAYVKNQNANFAQLTGANFTGDISLNTRLFVGSDASLNGKVYVGKDLQVIGNITGNYPSNSIPISAVIGGLGSSVDLSTNQTISGVKTFMNDVSLNSRLFIGGNLAIAGNNIVSNLYQTASDPSVNTISNLLKLTNNANGTYINQMEVSKSNGLTITYNTTNGTPLISNNGGNSWNTMSTTGTNTIYNAMVCISPDGRIILKQEYNSSTSTPYLYISTNWGSSYTSISLAQSLIYNNAYYGYNTYNDQAYAFSHDGSVLYFIARDSQDTFTLWKNTDSSFNSFTKQGSSLSFRLSNCPRAIATSGNGQYVLAITGVLTGNTFLYQSSNYGVTFTKTANSLNTTWNSIAVSYSGKYQTATDNNKVYQSSDFGITWSVVSSAPTAKWNSISMSNDGKNRVACIDTSYQYLSLDYGSNWSVIPNSFGNWKKAVMIDTSDNNIAIFSHDGVNIYKNYYYCVDTLQKTTINSDLNITTPYHYLNNIGKMVNAIKTNYFVNDSGVKMGMSNDGKYIVLPVANKQSLISQDYGYTWNYLNGLSSQTDYKYAVVSGNGQYMFIRKGSTTYWSINYGLTWSLFTGVANTTDNLGGIALSSTGQYMVFVGLDSTNNSNVYVSTNYGSTWTVSTAFPTSNNNFSAAISDSGQYMSVLSTNSYLLVSKDFGSTWTAKYTNALLNFTQISMSSNGQYQTMINATNIFVSSNYGANFNCTYSSSITPNFTSITMIGTGEYQYAVNSNDNKLYISNDYGNSWNQIYTNSVQPSKTTISRDGTTMVYSASGDIYMSRVADNTGSISSTAISISRKGIVSALDLSVNGTISTKNIIVDQIFENGGLLASKYATINSPAFTGTVTGITKAMIDLSNVDNTSDMNKPISTATQNALNLKSNIASPSFTGITTMQYASIANSLFITNDVSMNGNLLIMGDMSLNGNLYANYAPNTIPIDAIKGGIPSATGVFSYDISANLRLYVNGDVSLNSKLTVKNDGYFQNRLFVTSDVSLNKNFYVYGNSILNKDLYINGNTYSTKNINIAGDASMVGNVFVGGNVYENNVALVNKYAVIDTPSFQGTATFEKVAINQLLTVVGDSSIDGNVTITKDITTIGNLTAVHIYEGTTLLSNKYATLDSPTFTGTVSGITKAMVELGNVNNTSDVDKPISTAQQAAFDLKANVASPSFTGVPLAPTANTGTNTSQIATTAYVRGEIYNLIGSAPSTLNTLQELANAINSDASFATTVTNQIALKAPIESPIFTGTLTTPNLSVDSKLVVGGDVSMNSHLSVASDSSFNGNLYVGGKLAINSSFAVNDKLFVGGDLSVNGNITGHYKDNSIPSTAIQNIRNQYGQFQIQTQRKDIIDFDEEGFELSRSSGNVGYVETLYAYDSDLSLNGNLYINGGGTSVFANDVAVDSRLIVNNDATLEGNLYVAQNAILTNDVSMNSNLDLSGALIAHNNVNVYGIINQYTLSLEDGYKVNYDSEKDTIASLQAQVTTLQGQIASIIQILSNNNLH